MSGAIVGVGLWLALLSPGSAAPVRVPADLDAWLSERAGQLRSGPESEMRTRGRETLVELDRRLRAAGLAPPVARALASTDLSTAESGEAEPDPVGPAGAAADPAASLDLVRRRLKRFDQACAAPVPPGHVDARSALDEVLDDPVFGTEAPEASFLRRAGFRLRQWLGRVFGALAVIAVANATLLIVIGTILIVLSVAYLIGRLIFARRRALPSTVPATRIESLEHTVSPLDDLIARARLAAAEGRAVEALRDLAHGVVLSLRFRGLLPDEPGLTDLEGVARFDRAVDPAIRRDFEGLVQIHDRGVYGGAGASLETVHRAVELALRLVPAAVGERT